MPHSGTSLSRAGQHRDLVHRLDREQARKNFNALTKAPKSRGGAATTTDTNLITKAEANRQANSRADSLRNELTAVALQVDGRSDAQKSQLSIHQARCCQDQQERTPTPAPSPAGIRGLPGAAAAATPPYMYIYIYIDIYIYICFT